MELTADFRDKNGAMLFSSRGNDLVIRKFPEIESPEVWQEAETLYGVETAMTRSGEPLKLRPRRITLEFQIVKKEPEDWFEAASYARRQLHGKRVRLTLLRRENGCGAPLYVSRHPSSALPGEMYYEGVASVGGVEAEGRSAKLEIGLLADPWLYTQWRSETIEVNATDAAHAAEWTNDTVIEPAPAGGQPPLWCSAVRFRSYHRAGTRDADTGVIDAGTIGSENRLRVWWAGRPQTGYELFIETGGGVYDSDVSDAAAWSFAVTGGAVDYDPLYRSFNVLPVDLALSPSLAFTGLGTVTMEFREGLAI